MSQVISIKLPSHFKEACIEFQRELEVLGIKNNYKCEDFLISFDGESGEIRCEGAFPDSVYSALKKINKKYDGKLFYEDEEWEEGHEEQVEEMSNLEKIKIIILIIFFPVTLIYLFLRALVWVPFKIWKATR